MKKIVIVVAMDNEYELVSHILENPTEYMLNGFKCKRGIVANNEIVLARCGIGKVNAAVQVSSLIAEEKPNYIINSGVASGVGDGMQPGDVVVGSSTCYHDMWCGEGEWGQVQGLSLYFSASNELLDVVNSLDVNRLYVGLICTGDQFISDLPTLQSIKAKFPNVLAVDMESAAMAQVCHMRNTPFMSLRVVSDTPGMVHNNTAQYFDFFTDAPQRTFEVLKSLITRV